MTQKEIDSLNQIYDLTKELLNGETALTYNKLPIVKFISLAQMIGDPNVKENFHFSLDDAKEVRKTLISWYDEFESAFSTCIAFIDEDIKTKEEEMKKYQEQLGADNRTKELINFAQAFGCKLVEAGK